MSITTRSSDAGEHQLLELSRSTSISAPKVRESRTTGAGQIEGLWLGSTKHFYPRLNNGDSVVNLALRIVREMVARSASVDLNAENPSVALTH